MSVSIQEPSNVPAQNEWNASTRAQVLGLAACQLLLMPLGEWLSWRESVVHHVGLLVGFALLYLFVGFAIALPASLIGLLLPRQRRKALWLLLCSLVAAASFVPSINLSERIKRRALQGVMARAEPLIAAIRKFEAEHGKPPPEIAALVPGHLAALPTPGIGTAPHFTYLLTSARTDMGDNPWMLEVRPPVAGIGFDVFIYLPNQNYPKHGWGGVLERMGTWAYVHE